MRGLTPCVLRWGAALLVFATAATACAGGGERPTLADGRGASEIASAMEVLVDADAIEAVPPAAPPELLGIELARRVPPPVLAFELGIDEVPASSTADAADAVAGAEDTSDSADAVEPAPDVEPDPGVADGSATDATIEPSASDPTDATDESAPIPPVDVPAVPAGPDPVYADPSATVVSASGRPFAMPQPAAPQPPAGAVRGVTDESIVIGGLITESLAGFLHRDGVCAGAAARFEQANQHDDLSRRIDFRGCYDDVGDLSISEGLTNALVRDGVFAVVPVASDTWFADDVLTAAQVPYVGGDRLPAFCGRHTPFGFGTHGAVDCPVLDARGYATLTQPVLSAWEEVHDGRPPAGRDVHLVPAGPTGEVVGASRIFEADLIGRSRPTVLGILPTAADGPTSDWDEVVEAALAADPTVIFIDGDRTEGLPQAIRTAGFDGEVVLVGVVDPLAVAEAADRIDLAPLTVVSPGVDVANRSSPGWVAMAAAATTVGLTEADIGLDFVEGYLAADFVVRAVAATPEPLSGHALASVLNSGWWYPGIEGLACGSWWPASHYLEVPCLSVSRVEPFAVTPVLGLVETEPQLRFNLGG